MSLFQFIKVNISDMATKEVLLRICEKDFCRGDKDDTGGALSIVSLTVFEIPAILVFLLE